MLIDWLILMAVQLGLVIVLVLWTSDPAAAWRVAPVSAAINWAYFALFESSPAQATMGKMALGIKVTELGGSPISFRRASFRYWLKVLSTLTFGIGWLMAAATPRRQALHDVLAGSLVVRSGMSAATAGHWDPRVADFREYWDGTSWVQDQRR
jgi:uncharacterized RDD family membrane protein YckC